MASDSIGITLSIFERLTDRSPSATGEPVRSQWASAGELEVSVMNHLTALLNVRRSELPEDAAFPETSSSIAAYGILDLSSLSLANPADREKLRRSIDRAIRLFEPRLSRVQVILVDPQPQDPALRFRIEAMLRVEPIDEPVAFSAFLAKDTRHFEIIEARG